jgi:hypothetical protein
MEAFQAAATIEPELKLMLIAPTAKPVTQWPAPFADLLLLPAVPPDEQDESIRRLELAGWLQPSQSGRVAITLPTGSTKSIAAAARRTQTHGATALALCDQSDPSALTPADLSMLAPTFSSADQPRAE